MPTTAESILHLTPRDVAILEMVYAYHGCAVEHLHDRFWAEDSSLSVTYRRVARLEASRYLTAHRLPSLTGQGSGKALLTAGPRGRRLLAERRDIPLSQLPRQKVASSALFVHHHFAICDFQVALELATKSSGVELVQWTSEYQLKRTPMKIEDAHTSDGQHATRTITLIPDGAFTLSYQDRLEQGFLEMDMGTLAPKRLQLKLRGYLIHQTQLPVPIFFVTTTENRMAQIVQHAAHEAERLGADPTLIFVTTQNRVSNETILTVPIWQQAGAKRPVAILPSPPPDQRGTVVESVPTPVPAFTSALASGQRA